MFFSFPCVLRSSAVAILHVLAYFASSIIWLLRGVRGGVGWFSSYKNVLQTDPERKIHILHGVLFKPKKSGKNRFDHKRRLEKCSFPCPVTHYPVKSQRVGSWRKWDTTRILWLITIWQRPCNKEQNFHSEYRQTCHVCKANKNRTCLDIRYVIY